MNDERCWGSDARGVSANHAGCRERQYPIDKSSGRAFEEPGLVG
jgi:hypothetical protein